ncbi:hypothetical protein Cgig2_025472 [Carnegiea gigantea]|uniref:Uncharacterized protein n=1 Tax=Carnegiea gigantea TaxID=171969 RepID=A0A9Q1K7F4_9CARY|nr:hypothetical protein Cgig2_025472 [Carnegiea gigantea]
MAARELKLLVGPTMTFGLEDMRPLRTPHNDTLVIQLKIAIAMVCRILVDTKSSVDIITLECLKKLQYSEKDLEPAEAPIVGFGGQPTYPLRTKRLPVRVGNKDNSRTMETTFLVTDISMAYNVILGRPTLKAIKVMVAPYLLLVQFELDNGKVGKLYEDQKMTRECYYVSLKSLRRKEEPPSGEVSRPPKIGKKSATEAMVLLLASADEHGRPRPEPTSYVMSVPLDPICLERTKGTLPSQERWSVDLRGITTHGGGLLDPSSELDLAGPLEEAGSCSGSSTTTVGGISTLAEGPGSELATDTSRGYDTGLHEE